jgi:hypothetical protein
MTVLLDVGDLVHLRGREWVVEALGRMIGYVIGRE